MIDIGKKNQCMICPPEAASTCYVSHDRRQHPAEAILQDTTENDVHGQEETTVSLYLILAGVGVIAFATAVGMILGVAFGENLSFLDFGLFSTNYPSIG